MLENLCRLQLFSSKPFRETMTIQSRYETIANQNTITSRQNSESSIFRIKNYFSLTSDVSWEASPTNGNRKKYAPRQMQSDRREKNRRLTQLCKMILLFCISRLPEQSASRMFCCRRAIKSSPGSVPLSPRGTIAIKHENNEFKSHSKSILRSLSPTSQPTFAEMIKKQFHLPLRWCLGADEKRFHHERASERSRGGFPMARQTQKAVNEVMFKMPKREQEEKNE